MIHAPKPLRFAVLSCLLANAAFVLIAGCTNTDKSNNRLVVVPDAANDLVKLRLIFGYDAAQFTGGTAWMVARILEGSYSEADEHNLKALTALGAILTASAGREALCLDVSFPQSSLSQVTKFVAQRLSRVEIEDLEIDELRRIQLATLDSLRRDGDWLAHAVFWATAYHGTPYSLPAIGSDSTIGRINSGDVGSFSGMFITRGNYILGLSGPLTAAEAAAIDAQLQELLLSGVPSTRIPPTNPPSGLGVRIVEVPGLAHATILVGCVTPNLSSDSSALVLSMSAALQAVPTLSISGMDQTLRVERGLVDGIEVATAWIEASRTGIMFHTTELSHRDFIAVTMQPNPLNALYASRIVVKELADLNAAGLSTDDVLRMHQLLARAETADGDALSQMRTRLAKCWMGIDENTDPLKSKLDGLTPGRSRQMLRAAFDSKHLSVIAVVPDGERFRTEVLSGMSTYQYPDWVDRNEIRRLDQEYLSFRPFWQAEKTQLLKANELFR